MEIKTKSNHTLIKPVFKEVVSELAKGISEGETNIGLVINSEDLEIIDKEIYFESFGAKQVIIDDEKFLFIKDEDILGVIKKS